MNWVRRLLGLPALAPRERELVLVSYSAAEAMFAKDTGWRLAPEEDRNRMWGWVFIERDLPARGVQATSAPRVEAPRAA